MASLQKVTLTIPSGAAASNGLRLSPNVRELSILAPAALTGTVTLASGSDENADVSTTWNTVQSPPGTDITIAADKTAVLTAAPFPSIRLESTVNEGADRAFIVWLTIGE